MSFLKKIFGNKAELTNENSKVSTAHEIEDLIRVHDEYGRELQISKQHWLDNILLENLKKEYENPDALYGLLVSALNDGFERHIVDAATQLFNIDPLRERGACLYAIILMKNDQLDLAETVLTGALREIGESGVILTNLAKVYSQRGEIASADQTLLRALELDPNQDNGLSWYLSICHERDGQNGYVDALNRISTLPGAWRPQLWLARMALENKDKALALSIYREIFSRLKNPDSQVLHQVSGDLGLNGFLNELIELVEPYFQIDLHGLLVANNLIKAYIDLKQYAKAKNLLSQLFARNRADWMEGLKYWQNELDNLTGDFGPVEDSQPVLTMWSVDKPVWLHRISGAEDLFSFKKNSPLKIIITSASCTLGESPNQLVRQKTNIEGTLCRGVPLTLCDKLNLCSNSSATILVPIVNGAGFAFFGHKYDDEFAAQLLQMSPAKVAILPHLYAANNLWTYELRLYSENETNPLKILSVEFDPNSPAKNLEELIESTYSYLFNLLSLQSIQFDLSLENIPSKRYAHFIDANESSLALSLACNVAEGANTLYGERNIFDKFLYLALEEPKNDVYKLMLISSMAKNRDYGSSIYKEYEEKVKKLVRDNATYGITAQLLNETIEEIYLEQ